MRVMSEETMASIISYIDQYYCDKHTTPSAGEISMGVGIPRTTAYRYLVEMDNRGMIEYDGKSRTIRTPMINKFAPDSAPCPLVDPFHAVQHRQRKKTSGNISAFLFPFSGMASLYSGGRR